MQIESVEQKPTGLLGFVQETGFAIRDWLGPIYTLIGFVTLTIGFFALIDSTGFIVRAIAAALFLASILSWCYYHIKKFRTQTKPTGPQLHHVLFTIALFFGVGLLINEFLLHGKRKALEAALPTGSAPADPQSNQTPTPPAPTATAAPTASASPPAPAASGSTQAPSNTAVANTAAATASATPAAPATVAAPVAKAPATQPPTQAHAPEAARERPASAKPAPTTSTARNEREDTADHAARAPARTERAETRRSSPSGDAERCSNLLGKFSLGQNLSDADRHYLETSCR